MRPKQQQKARHDELFRAHLDQINTLMSAVGYNFRLILKWLRYLWCKIITAIWGAMSPTSAFKQVS
jgi:IS5 family transposase